MTDITITHQRVHVAGDGTLDYVVHVVSWTAPGGQRCSANERSLLAAWRHVVALQRGSYETLRY